MVKIDGLTDDLGVTAASRHLPRHYNQFVHFFAALDFPRFPEKTSMIARWPFTCSVCSAAYVDSVLAHAAKAALTNRLILWRDFFPRGSSTPLATSIDLA